MLQLEEKVQAMDLGVQRLFTNIEALQKKGLHGLKVINDKLMTLLDYKKRLAEVSKDSSKFTGIQGRITDKEFLYAFSGTSSSNMRFNTFSSPSLHSPSTQRWTKCIEGCSKSMCPVILDGRNSMISSISR
jgi:hypothetical protein